MFKYILRCAIWAISALICSCGDYASLFIEIQNKSDNEIACVASVGYGSSSGFTYPEDLQYIDCLEEHISDRRIIHSRRESFDLFFESTMTGHYFIYIFDQETVNQLGWEEVLKNNHYLVRYDYTKNDFYNQSYDLEGETHIISYPPAFSMKNVQMIPPYDSFIQP